MFLVFDTETTGLTRQNLPESHPDHWPRMVQLAWQLHDDEGRIIDRGDLLVKPGGAFDIPFQSEKIHGISTALAEAEGKPLAEVLERFGEALRKTRYLVGHNLAFDLGVVGAEMIRAGKEELREILLSRPVIDTMSEEPTVYVGIPGRGVKGFKYPKLEELYQHLFHEKFAEAHNAAADVEATARAFFELLRLGVIPPEKYGKGPDHIERLQNLYPEVFPPYGLRHRSLKEASARYKKQKTAAAEGAHSATEKADFAHLHLYSQFTVLESTVKFDELVRMAAESGMPALAVTDKGNMMGVFNFWREVTAHNASADDESKKIKPIIGLEVNVCENHLERNPNDKGHPVILLAKNKTGYHNLVKLVSIANTDGYYYAPRIDKDLLRRYREGLIAISGGRYGEIAHNILQVGTQVAEEKLQEWIELFGDDFYLEVLRHHLDEEENVNETFRRFSEKYGVKLVAGNEVYYLRPEQADVQEVLLAIRDGKKLDDPVGSRRSERYALPNKEFYFKSPEEMNRLFRADFPDALDNIREIIDKVEEYELAHEIVMPVFEVPEEFAVEGSTTSTGAQQKYLRHLVWEGAHRRWGDPLPDNVRERLEYELGVIERLGFVGYFLIVWDVINKAREMGVLVGAGRGSAAGSAVSYTLGITNVDPIKYDLLFERFLNPDRKTMPDIDMDFDDVGRAKVIEYAVEKYGKENVAHIITYGFIKSKSAIRDTFRVLGLPLGDADRLSKLASMPLRKILDTPKEEFKKMDLRSDVLEKTLQFKEIIETNDDLRKGVEMAATIEGAIRNKGLHACGYIISPQPIADLIPVTKLNKTDLLVTQFDNKVVEDAGLLKMDFLGIKTLSIVKDAIRLVQQRHGVEIDLDTLGFDDEKTYQLLREGKTIGVFQLESNGMRKYLTSLKPSNLEDIIAMVALYRPGPMEKIPNFIRRKHGLEEVKYDLPEMEEILKNTYGITVYQEQVMLLSQKLADFTGGEADTLRKAMGKKKKKDLDKMYPKFIKQAKAKGFPEKILQKIWKDWEAFASYAFNRSHAVSYAVLAYHTAYLKANYPAEFFAASLSHHLSNQSKVTNFIEDARQWDIRVLSPDVNESDLNFTVNAEGNIRFGLSAIKGVGTKAAERIIEERNQNGPFKDIYDFVERLDSKAVNARVMEALVLSGAFDRFGWERHLYFCPDKKDEPFYKSLLNYGQKFKAHASEGATLFDTVGGVTLKKPEKPGCEAQWSVLDMLERERDLVGFYISGHPLDQFREAIEYMTTDNSKIINAVLKALNEKRDVSLEAGEETEEDTDVEIEYEDDELVVREKEKDKDNVITYKQAQSYLSRRIKLYGIVKEARVRSTKEGREFAFITMEDYQGTYEAGIFDKTFLDNRAYLQPKKMLALDVRIQHNRYRDSYSLRIERVTPLYDLLKNSAKGLVVYMDELNTTEDTVRKLHEILKKYKGKKSLKFRLSSVEDRFQVEMSSGLRIDISEDLLKELKSHAFDVKLF